MTYLPLLIYFSVLSVISLILTVGDKYAAKHKKRRVAEATLLLFGFLGGAGVMYLTMRLIHHKTKHKKFMITLPVFFLLHLIAIAAYWLRSRGML